MALKEKTIDMAGNTLRVNSIEIGSTKPGVAGTDLATSQTIATLTSTTAGITTANITTGNITNLVGGVSTRTGAGAIDVTNLVTRIVTTGADALTLADGTNGQVKILIMSADGGAGTLTPTTKTGFATLTFDDVGDSAMLVFLTTVGWMLVGTPTATVG